MRVTAGLAAMVPAIGASAQTTPTATGNACSLLTKDDAAAALGEAVKGPRATSMPEASSCEYSGSGIHVVILNVMPLTAATSAMYKAMCAEAIRPSPGRSTTG
jgi:hypothetical protein